MAGLTLIALVLTFYRLGAAGVCGANEAIEGLFVQQMVENGELLFPLANGADPMYKPPLFHWTATAVSDALGMHLVTPAILRAPSALYASAGVALTVGFALTMLDLPGAVLAGVVLLSSYQYVSEGRIGRVDMTLTFFESLALFSFLWWLPKKASEDPVAPARTNAQRTELRYLFAAALALAVLAKGPVGAMLPLLAIAVFCVGQKRWKNAQQLFSPGSALLAIGLASSWYLACVFGRRYGFLNRQIGSENFGRFFGSLGEMAPTYYLKPILLNSVPASLLAPFAVIAALSNRQQTAELTRAGSSRRAVSSVKLFAIFWLVTVAFFSIAAYKRRAYLLPLWPPTAVLIAWWIGRLAERRWGRVIRNGAFIVFGALIIFNLFYIPSKQMRECVNDPVLEAAVLIKRAVAPDEPLFIYGVDQGPPSLLFYLDRQVPLLHGNLDDAPPGYVIIPADVWLRHRKEAPELEPVLTAGSGPHGLILLRRGKLYG
ncbi:MAG TPA: phospholipid carrier-dependent glycosyltransferase [Candidatus Binataceae bacterium]|nr:phospholipid carrier-dependent glycosyltransferase [Candidatus Binataceae bacterium]